MKLTYDAQAVREIYNSVAEEEDRAEKRPIYIKLRESTSQKLKSSGTCFSFLYSAPGKGWENETQRVQQACEIR